MQTKLAVPGLCDVTDFGLSDVESNHREALKLLKKKVESLWGTPTHDFFRTGDWASGGYLVLYNKKRGLIAYLVKFKVHSSGVASYKKVVTQVALWRSLTDPVSKGMAEKVFFDTLLPHYGAVMSDNLQTPRGRDFWISIMTQANALGYEVAFIDRNRHSILYKPSEMDMNQWVAERNTWGTAHKHMGEKFLIAMGD